MALKSGETVGHLFLLSGLGLFDATSFAGVVPNAVHGGKALVLGSG
jgi:hypothetical protein